MTPEKNASESQKIKTSIRTSIIREWEMITLLLGHTPSYEDVEKLKDAQETRYSPSVYARKFGEGRFYQAKSTLEQMLATREGLKEAERDVKQVPLEDGLNRLERGNLLPPSRSYAHILGVLSGGGSISNSGMIKLVRLDQEFLESYGQMAEQVFQVNTTLKPSEGKSMKVEIHYGRQALQLIGSLSRKEWPATLLNKHSWVLDNTNYTWGFLGGFFDTSGSPVFESRGRRGGKQREKRWYIHLHTSYLEAANLLAHMLTLVGIESPKLLNASGGKIKRGGYLDGIAGIKIRSMSDIQNFILNIHSMVPKKEGKLDYLRELFQIVE